MNINLFHGNGPILCALRNRNETSARNTAQKMKFSIKDLFSKCDQIHRKLQIRSHLLRKSLMGNFIFCALKWVMAYFFSRRKLKIAILSRLWHVNEYFLENSVMCMWERQIRDYFSWNANGTFWIKFQF